ncbi:MAG: beta-ketoacyl-[acyl-carrier-protein] synthase family protein [Firmicutes bacterium]|nr:beta-ketoacyl-[acyl-carrier-protein] synthase family protein [Bacillota bacterium]
MKHRVVITGLGIISAIGYNVNTFLSGLKNNQSGVKPILRFNTAGYRTNLAAEVQNWNPQSADDSVSDRCLQFVYEATNEAIKDSGIDFGKIDLWKTGVSIATSLGCVDYLEKYIQEKSVGNICINWLDNIPHCIPGSVIAAKYGLRGPVISIDTACASGTNSIGYAFDLIQKGDCDVMLTGGVDILNPLSFSGFSSMMNLTKTLCRPFDKNRSGLVLGEGCAIVVLESLEHAQRRNTQIYGEILGYGLSNDAFHETQPDPDAKGAVSAMQMAIEYSGIAPSDIDYINTHGTGTKFNDLMEVKAIRQIFKEHSPKLKLSSIKAAIGHTLGAAGSIEFLASVLCVFHDFIPPTLNFEMPMEGCEDLDFVPNVSQNYPVQTVMSNSFGFAGNCSSIIVSKFRNR